MIRRLRNRFIASALLSMFLVLFTIISAANIINYHRISSQADNILTMIADNQGQMPTASEQFQQKNGMNRETPFESRYFSVILTNSGKTVSINTRQIASVDKKQAVRYARKVLNSGHKTGFYKNYRFLTQNTGNGQTAVCFLDCGRSLDNFQDFLTDSFMASLAGMIAVFVLILLLSKMAMRPANESYRRQRQFITDAGHEIKTPLTVIDADLMVLEMEQGSSEWSEDIRKQVHRLTDLTNRLIRLSKLEEGAPEDAQQKTVIDLSRTVRNTAESFQSRAKVERKEFTMSIHPEIRYLGDKSALEELTSILLDNALKYSPEGGKITLSLKKERKDVRLTVTNTAQLQNTENLEHLFDRFYRDDASHNAETGGYGIGLSIAKAAAEMHHGKITASSEDGKSLTMTVILR
jgi:two-component system sensor histidine kinase CiaH